MSSCLLMLHSCRCGQCAQLCVVAGGNRHVYAACVTDAAATSTRGQVRVVAAHRPEELL